MTDATHEAPTVSLSVLLEGPISPDDQVIIGAFMLDVHNRITALTTERDALAKKLAEADGALSICSASWGECNRILDETKAKLARAEALLAAHEAWAAGEPSQPPVTGRDKTTFAADGKMRELQQEYDKQGTE